LGFMGGVVSRTLDRDKVTTSSQFDGFTWNGLLPDGETFGSSYSYFDLNIGMSYNSSLGGNDKNNFFLGAAYHHLNEPRNSFYTELTHVPKWVLSGGLRFTMGDISYMTFYSDYSKQGGFSEFIGGATYSRMFGDYERPDLTLHVGTYLRWQDALVLTTKIDFDPIAIGFSYDVNVSSLRTASEGRGAFEFSLNYTAFSKRDKSSSYSTRCPRF
jgi:Type IX secretion system membrane protein PorP/SprF